VARRTGRRTARRVSRRRWPATADRPGSDRPAWTGRRGRRLPPRLRISSWGMVR